MELIYFFAGLLLAFGRARYNESNKLFWQLTLAFLVGYAGIVLATHVLGNDERNNGGSNQVSTTQMPAIVQANPDLFSLIGSNGLAPKKVTALHSAIQYDLDVNEPDAIPSEVFGRTRDQPTLALLKPPERHWFYNTS